MSLDELAKEFLEAGLVFLVMAFVIYFLYKEWRRTAKRCEKLEGEKEQILREHSDYVRDQNQQNTEVMITLNTTLDKLIERIKGQT